MVRDHGAFLFYDLMFFLLFFFFFLLVSLYQLIEKWLKVLLPSISDHID